MRGIDTTFLIQVEISQASDHNAARSFLREAIWGKAGSVCLAPQVLSEFLHIVTDRRRLERPMPMIEAIRRAAFWWDAPEIRRVYPDEDSMRLMLLWMQQYNLGRKRILDTQLAATYFEYGVREILSTNERDFSIFPEISVVDPSSL